MRPWKKRSAKHRCYEYITAIFLAVSSVFYLPLAENKQPAAILVFLFVGLIVFMISIDLTKNGKNKKFKDIFNAIWNFEAAFVFCYGLISFINHAGNEKTLSSILNTAFDHNPSILIGGALFLFVTVMFRCGLSLAELLIDVKSGSQKK